MPLEMMCTIAEKIIPSSVALGASFSFPAQRAGAVENNYKKFKTSGETRKARKGNNFKIKDKKD